VGEVKNYPNGHFCWVDLGATDLPGAKAFYGGLLGWEFEDVSASEGQSYTMCRMAGKDVAGIHSHSEEEGTGWTSYISVDDVEATSAQARVLGGSLVLEPQDIPGTARVAVVKDPTRAEVSLWQAQGFVGARLVNEVGTWAWNELTTPDLDTARSFYSQLFGWETADVPVGIPRLSFSLGGYLIGAAHTPQPGEGDDPRWTVSFLVADADESAAKAQELGGSVLMPVRELPIGKFAVVADPFGASFTIAAAQTFRGLDGA
jgi:predicted enzyme related to lactoylglutathione lyase